MINLMLGDCLERMKEIPDGSVDMILADPPYGTTACKWDTVIPFDAMWFELKRIIKPNGAIVMMASQPFTSALCASNFAGFKYCAVWDKKIPAGMSYARYRPMQQHEDIVVFSKDGAKLNYIPQVTERLKPISAGGNNFSEVTPIAACKNGGNFKKEYTTKQPTTILQFAKVRRGALHPTQKPVDLMEYLIKTYTQEGETVLDFAAGSFTTGVACVNINRKFIGIELDKNYFDIGVNRIKERIKCLDLKIEPMISMGD
jgi:site-specific DNA-methyltransferase (adenine-specific)